MTAINTQKAMNNTLASRKPNFKKAYELFNQLNEQRQNEGLPFFTMPNLQARFKDTRKDF